MGKATGIADQHSVAFRIASLLRPASVLGIGDGIAALLESLASCGVAGITHAASLEQLAGLAGEYDLAVYADATDQARSMIQGAAGLTDRILFFPSPDGSQDGPLLPALRLFDEAGFSPDFSTNPVFFTNSAVLFRRVGTTTLPTPAGYPLLNQQDEMERLVNE